MDVFWTFRPLCLLSKLFGQWTTSVQQRSDANKSVTWGLIDRLTSALAVAVNLVILSASIKNGASTAASLYFTNIGASAYPWSMRYTCAMLSCLILINWIFRSRFQRLFRVLDKCDAMLLEAVQTYNDAKYQRKCILWLIAIVLGLNLAVGVTTAIVCKALYENSKEVIPVTFSLVYTITASHTFISVAISFIGAFWFRFRDINRGLRMHFLPPDDRDSMEFDGDSVLKVICRPFVPKLGKPEVVRHLATIHHYLCDTVELFNSCSSFQVGFL